MAKLTKPPIPLKMYKHFAVVTLTLTAAIAMFADDGNRQAMVEQIGERERQAELREASAAITGPPRLARAEAVPQGSFGSENRGFGEASAPAPRTHRAVGDRSRGRGTGGMSTRGRISVPGYDQEWIDALSEQEYEIFREQAMQGNLASDDEDRAAARQRMMDRQRRRSGHQGGSDYMP